MQFVFLQGREPLLKSEEKTTLSVVGDNGREKRFSVSAENLSDLLRVTEVLLPDHGLTIAQQDGTLVLQGQVSGESDSSRLDAIARCFFPSVDNRLVTSEAASTPKQGAAMAAGVELKDRKVQQLMQEVGVLRRRIRELTSQPRMSVLDDEPVVYRPHKRSIYTPADCLIYFHRSFAGNKDPVVRALREASDLYVMRPWQDVDGTALGYKFQVKTHPTLILVRDKQEVGRIEGEFTDDQLKKLLESP